jgi:histidinol-phosphate aminotransferase
MCEHVQSLNRITYVSEEEAPASAQMLDCSLGINPFGCSSAVMHAVAGVSPPDLARYPQFPYQALKKQISEYWSDTADVPEDCIRLGNGAIGILDQLNKIFINRGSKALGYSPQFTDYINDVYGHGGKYEFYRLPREKNYAFNCDDFLGCLRSDHSILYLDNPNNPTGQVIPLAEILEIVRRAHRMNICVIIDEAYGEYMPASNSAVNLLNQYENLMIVKSFSKGFGIAGLRAGYLVACKRLIEYYQQVEIPFSINSYGQMAVGAALGDKAFIENSVRNTAAVKAEMVRACQKLTCAATSIQTPILVLTHPDETMDLCEVFLRNHVLTEAGDGFLSLPRSAVRMRVPTEEQEIVNIIRRIEKAI